MGSWFLLFFRTLVRERNLLLMYLAVPVLFLLAFHASFGSPASGFAASLRVAVVAPAGEPRTAAAVEKLRAQRFGQGATMTVGVTADPDAAFRALGRGQVCLVLDLRTDPPSLTSDPGSSLGPYAESFVREALAPAPFTVSYASGSGGTNDFLSWLPGIVVFGAVFGAMLTSVLLTQELRRRTFDRIKLANARLGSLAAGLWAALAVLTLVQALLTLALARALGYEFPVPAETLILGAAAGSALLSLLSLALGLLTAGLVASEAAATMVSVMVLAPYAFFTGTVFPLASPELFRIAGSPVLALDILSPGPVIRALSDLWVRGLAPAEVLPVPFLVGVAGILLVLVPALILFRIRRLPQGA